MKKIAIALLYSVSLFAQTKAKPADVVIKQVNDRRTNGHFANLTIYLELPKFKASEVAGSRILIAEAVDDSGRNLVDAEAGEPRLESSGGRMGRDEEGAPQPATVSLTLKNPDRKATKVKTVRGEIELFMPSKDANSVAEIPKFTSSSGKTLSHRALGANGVEIAVISPAQIDAEKKRYADAKRKEAKDAGMEGEGLDSYVKSSLESYLALEPDEVLVRIKDPNKRIQEVSYVDAAGETKHVSMREDEGYTRLSTWGDKPQPDWKLRVSMKTAKNLVRQPFALADVPLP